MIYRLRLFILMLVMLLANDLDAQQDFTLMPQTLTFLHDSGNIALRIDLPESWFINEVENQPLYRITNYEAYTSEVSASVPLVPLEAGDYSLHIQASPISSIRPADETAVELLNRFGISAVADARAEPFDAGDGRDVAIIEDLNLRNGHLPVGSGVALLERRGDTVIYILALTERESGDVVRDLVLHILESAEIGSEAAQIDEAPTFEYDTYSYLEDDLTFEYPSGWTVVAQRTLEEFQFTLTSMSHEDLYPPWLLISSPEDLLIIGHVAAFSAETTAFWIEQYVEVAEASCPEGVNVEACAIYIGDVMQSAERYLGFVPVVLPEVEPPEITQVENGFFMVSLATDTDWVMLYTAVRGAKIIALTGRENAFALRSVLERLADTIRLDVNALLTHDDELPTIPQQHVDLGENGFEVWGVINRAMVVTEATWLSEPSFRNLERIQQDTFDFYVTSDPHHPLESSYVWFQDVPLDIQPGIIESYTGSLVTFKDGERLTRPMEGVLTIETVEEGGISGSFIGFWGRLPAGRTLTRVVFSDGECERSTGLTIDLNYPAWIEDYPEIEHTIRAYLNMTMRDYMQEMVNSPYDYTQVEHPLGQTVTYYEVAYDDEIVTVIFQGIVDYGGLYPLDSLQTFTLHKGEDRHLQITDILRDGVEVIDVFQPFVEAQLGQVDALTMLYTANDEARVDYPFILRSDQLTLVYPFSRLGPIHAGGLSVVIPLDEITDDLNEDIFGD